MQRMYLRLNAYRILIALALGCGALWIFAEVVEEVFFEQDIVLDKAILRGLRSPLNPAVPLGPPWVESLARDITALGSFIVITILTVAVVAFLLIAQKGREAVFVLASVIGGTAVSQSAKALFGRVRPDIVPPLVDVSSTSFPSGHAMMSAVAYLTLAALIARLVPRFALRAYVVGVGVFLAVIVGISRVYLGVHWPTDVLAGWSLGAAWALLCWSAADWRRKAFMPLSRNIGIFSGYASQRVRKNDMGKHFKVGDHVTWNSEAGHVSGRIIKVHTLDTDYKGHTRHASRDEPQYEIQSDKTDHIAMHKGSALKKLSA